MLILEIVLNNQLGGIGVRALHGAVRLRERGIETIFLVPDTAGDLDKLAKRHGFVAIRIPLTRPSLQIAKLGQTLRWFLGLPCAIGCIRRIIREHHVHVVHVNGLLNIEGAVAARSTGCPLVWHLANTVYPRWMVRLIVPYALRNAYVISISARVREYFVGTGSFRRNECVLHEPIDLELIHRTVAHPAGQRLRVQLNLPDSACVALAVGNITPLKGWHTLVEAASLLGRTDVDIRLVIVGAELQSHASYARGLRIRVGKLHLTDRVYFVGWRNDVLALLKEADLFVSASVCEGTPLAIMEAMASGLPILASAVGGVPDLVEEGQTGLLVPPNDARSLAIALQGLARNRILRERLGRAAAISAERYSIEKYVTGFERVLIAATSVL